MIKKYQNEFKGARRPYFERLFEKRNSDEPRVKQIHKYQSLENLPTANSSLRRANLFLEDPILLLPSLAEETEQPSNDPFSFAQSKPNPKVQIRRRNCGLA